MVSEVDDADSNPVAQWVTPFTGDMENGRFVLMAGWPNFPAMGKAFGNFFKDGAGDEIMVEWAATATCDARNLYIVEELHNSLGQEAEAPKSGSDPWCGGLLRRDVTE